MHTFLNAREKKKKNNKRYTLQCAVCSVKKKKDKNKKHKVENNRIIAIAVIGR